MNKHCIIQMLQYWYNYAVLHKIEKSSDFATHRIIPGKRGSFMKQKKQIIAPKSFTTQIIVSALDNRAIPEVVYLEIQNPDRGRKQFSIEPIELSRRI